MAEDVAAGGAARESRAAAGRLSRRALYLGWGSALTGILLILLGFGAAVRVPHEIYPGGGFAGYDPPIDAAAGFLLLVLSPALRDRTPIAWFFSLLAPLLTATIAVLSPDVFSITSAVAATALVATMYPYRGAFYRGSAVSPQAIELMIIVVGLLALLYGVVGSRRLGDDFSPPIHSWGEAVYFTVTTISTNGSEISPLTSLARWFEVTLILLGVGTFLSAIVVLFLPFLERRLKGIGQRLERAQMQELSRHVIVCGAGPEAVAAARSLREQGVPVVIVAPEEKTLDTLKAEGFRTHTGDPSSEEDLKLIGIDRARAVVVSQDSDAANLLTVITARALQPSLRIVAVATSDQTLPKLQRAGANEAISIVGVAAQLMSAAALDSDDAARPHGHTIAH